MSCNNCPHHVRHGQFDPDSDEIIFQNLCGLKLKRNQNKEIHTRKKKTKPPPLLSKVNKNNSPDFQCENFPFEEQFSYYECLSYKQTFATIENKNNVVPTKDFQFSEKIGNFSVTDMELL